MALSLRRWLLHALGLRRTTPHSHAQRDEPTSERSTWPVHSGNDLVIQVLRVLCLREEKPSFR